MKITPEKSNVTEWLRVLDEASKGQRYQALFKRVYKLTAVPSRRREPVSIYKINKYTKKGDTVVVPRKVLSTGKMDHEVNIAALEYSAGALAQLKAAGCKVLTIKELTEHSKVSIII